MKVVLVALGLALTACASAGPYGYARTYEPLDDEETAAAGAIPYDPVMAKRSPEKWKGKTISVYGVVASRTPGQSGNAEATLSVRTLEERNACDSADEDSCRVTVSDHEYAVVHVLLHLSSEDDIGEHSMGPASLVRVIGTLTDEVDQGDGEPVLKAKYYRHWPRGFYRTTADRRFMRQ
jgi:hypothetical protein